MNVVERCEFDGHASSVNLIINHPSQIFFVLYALLYRTAIFAANKEIDKTKQFVLMLPVGVLTRQDLECVKAYFVASDMDHHFEMEDDELAKCAEDSDVDQRKDIVRRGQ
mmetsp:Transcript_74208/g.198022  ORF Transcript_74208/g.198022 Transcript_74208/m.198022 type:complete len:110 (-) Transcript_74208:271-600(-)